MSDAQIAIVAILSFIVPFLAIATVGILVRRKLNDRIRRVTHTRTVHAKVIHVERRDTYYQERLPRNPYIYYTLEYSFNGIPYMSVVQEVVGTPREGDTLALRINPYHPERVYVECVAENVDRRVRSIILVFSLIVVPLVLILLWFRLSIF